MAASAFFMKVSCLASRLSWVMRCLRALERPATLGIRRRLGIGVEVAKGGPNSAAGSMV